jgi:hypothetical protein
MYFNSPYEHYLIFDCYQSVILKSVKVYSASSANRIINLRDSNDVVLQTKTVYIPSGESRINLDFEIPVGNNLQLQAPVSPNLYRNDYGASYPYNLSNIISIKYNSADDINYYYFFYDWEIQEPPCVSERSSIDAMIMGSLVANITPSDTVYINPGDSITLIASSGDDFMWYPTNEITQSITVGDTGSYTVEVVSNSCVGSAVSEATVVLFEPNIVSLFSDNNEKISIYPNPTSDILYIELNSNKNAKINLYDIVGNIILYKEFQNPKSSINNVDIRNIPTGIYFMTIETNKQKLTKKIIKI